MLALAAMDAPHLREARLAAGLSQEALAAKAQCSISYVRMLENGYRPGPGSPTMARIVKALEDTGIRYTLGGGWRA